MVPAAPIKLGESRMPNMENTPVYHVFSSEDIEEMKKSQEDRHRKLIEAGNSAKAAIEEFLNGTGD